MDENNHLQKEKKFSIFHIKGIETSISFCDKKKIEMQNISTDVFNLAKKLRDIKNNISNINRNENENENVNKLLVNISNIVNEEYIENLGRSAVELENRSNDFQKKKETLKKLKDELEVYYHVKFDSNLMTNIMNSENQGRVSAAKQFIQSKRNEKKIESRVAKLRFKFPDEIILGKIDESSEQGQELINKHFEEKLAEQKKNIWKATVSGTIRLFLKGVVIAKLGPIIELIPGMKRFTDIIIDDVIMNLVNKGMGYEAGDDPQLGFIEGSKWKLVVLNSLLIDYRNNIKRFTEEKLTKEQIIQCLQNIKGSIDNEEISARLIELISKLDDFSINKDEIIEKINGLLNKFSYRIKDTYKIIEFILPENLKRERTILTELTGNDSSVRIIKSKVRYVWRTYSYEKTVNGKNWRMVTIYKLFSGFMTIGMPTLIDFIGDSMLEILGEKIPILKTIDLFEGTIEGGALKIISTAKDSGNIAEIKKGFSTALASEWTDSLLKDRAKKIVLYAPKILGTYALKENSKFLDKEYYDDINNLDRDAPEIICNSVKFITKIYRRISHDYGGRYLR